MIRSIQRGDPQPTAPLTGWDDRRNLLSIIDEQNREISELRHALQSNSDEIMDKTTERERFEKWISAPEQGYHIKRLHGDGLYLFTDVQLAWEAWQERGKK
jgi:hypothetical protein